MKTITLFFCIISLCSAVLLEMDSKDFSIELIQHLLNSTDEKSNFAVAPQEAYELFQELFESHANYFDDFSDETTPPPILERRLDYDNITTQNISLKAQWTFNFQTRDTNKRPFHQLGLRDQKTYVDFLRKDDVFNYAKVEQLNATILELPMHFNEIKFVLIIPDQMDGLDDLKEYLSENMDEFEEISKKSLSMTLVRVLLPKFNIMHEESLVDFYDDISSADVDKYDNIQQFTNLELSERGIGKFERTTVLFWNAYSYMKIAPEVVDISHPFLFMITDKEGIQFFGQVVKCET